MDEEILVPTKIRSPDRKIQVVGLILKYEVQFQTVVLFAILRIVCIERFLPVSRKSSGTLIKGELMDNNEKNGKTCYAVGPVDIHKKQGLKSADWEECTVTNTNRKRIRPGFFSGGGGGIKKTLSPFSKNFGWGGKRSRVFWAIL